MILYHSSTLFFLLIKIKIQSRGPTYEVTEYTISHIFLIGIFLGFRKRKAKNGRNVTEVVFKKIPLKYFCKRKIPILFIQ